ncbi:thiamine biosynthesis protein ThiS [Oceanobacillus oncorhynchi subsp. incaldanensis]|uniref:Sulfur carrier protein ThiS n=2 Tax=Oceanobacillus TaxID=182709 RepID=A0A0A1MQD8_9BACI|nr:sulfur carrier protein ThiS [Oceanobacillus oncorhynchi]MDM8099865.1 sulfur carrier protein ThiS [Oceanobacillus oncorhynchi]UUI40403.1 sulfur carrier protein ThiS [Oceanobacillus oncorhynchi]GIO18666.1 thiamine biosynthesis protein ThiS [Oceanobacillus oncorhynchi subsp. incaldanensis]CEI81827.1 sulfur carrier protein ThiS [Oceanobacillus oncorhynchi]
MKITVNGNGLEVQEEVKHVKGLIDFLGLEDKPLIIEHNQQILQKEEHEKAVLENGDKVEIVHFVGGG